MKLTGTHAAEHGPPSRPRSFGQAFRASLDSNTTGFPRRTATHEKGGCDLDHRSLDDAVCACLLVGHFERFDELAAERVSLCLESQFLLKSHAFGDIAGIDHHPAQATIVAQVGEVGFNVPPFAGRVADPQIFADQRPDCPRPG